MKQQFSYVRIPRMGKATKRGTRFACIWYEIQKDGSSHKVTHCFPAGTTLEEAEAERQRLYIHMLLNGARFKEKTPVRYAAPPPKPPKQFIVDRNSDECLTPIVKKVRFWKVFIDGDFIGMSVSKVKARKIRDHYLDRKIKERKLPMPCAVCGKRPSVKAEVLGQQVILRHEEEECPNKVWMQIKEIGAQGMIRIWNEHLMTGRFGKTGHIGLRDIPKTDTDPPQ